MSYCRDFIETVLNEMVKRNRKCKAGFLIAILVRAELKETTCSRYRTEAKTVGFKTDVTRSTEGE